MKVSVGAGGGGGGEAGVGTPLHAFTRQSSDSELNCIIKHL